MLSQKQELEKYEQSVKEALGQDPNTPVKLAWLREKWEKENKETSVSRIIWPILFEKVMPIHFAIIADNLDYFRDHYKQECNDYETALIRACLCGSKRIADFLLAELNSSYTADDSTDLLGYISASMNTDWMKEIAYAMAKAKITMPTSVYGLAHNDEIIDMIVDIFKNPSQENAPSYKKSY